MKIKNYIYPGLIYESLTDAIKDLKYLKTYKSVLEELEAEGKLEALGLKKEKDKLFVGVNLNPELLMYTEDSQESVELKFISDAMKKYTDFLGKEGILDSIKADYERVFTDDFYGYVVQISYKYRSYKKEKFRYDIGYTIAAAAIVGAGLYLAITSLL
jgi:hypothetical protein